jgi:nitroreductase
VDAQTLISSYDRNGILGELTGVLPASLDRLFRESHDQMQAALEQARRKAAEQARQVSIDASRLSGTNGSDWWRVAPDGSVTRQMGTFPAAETQLSHPDQTPKVLRPCPDIARARPLLARCAYNGLWSPSGTNWQPIRMVELTNEEVAALTAGATSGCALAILTRSRYQSILSDIAGICGFEQTSHAESIDLGIWMLVAEQTARAHGWTLDHQDIPGDGSVFVEKLSGILEKRTATLKEPSREAAAALLRSIKAGDHVPVALLLPREKRALTLDANQVGNLPPSPFDRLVEARGTQRVASARDDLEPDRLATFFETARNALGQEAEPLECPVFTRRDDLPALVGKAMHEGIEGPEGLLARTSLPALRSLLCTCSDLPDDLAEWTRLEEEELPVRGKQVCLPARLVPAHIAAKLQESGHFREKNGVLLDHRDRPLNPVRLMKLVRLMSRSFGKFFLSFQNTHPLLGLILTRSGADPLSYRAVGRVVAHMTLLARAQGMVSIIKSGPLEIAGSAIRDLLAGRTDDHPESESMEPALTFQLGWPLGPDEIVSPGQPDEHSGLAERLLDKRAPRAPLSAHYIPTA